MISSISQAPNLSHARLKLCHQKMKSATYQYLSVITQRSWGGALRDGT